MIVILQALMRCFRMTTFQRAKPFTLHISLLILVLAYSFFGGIVLDHLETEPYHNHQQQIRAQRKACMVSVLLDDRALPYYSPARNETPEKIARCFDPPRDVRSEWSFVTATLFGFGIITTLGYNRITPITYAGRMFCIVYGICGIPITMIIIANVGQYMNRFAGESRRKLEAYRTRRRMSKASLSGKEYKESSIQVTSLVLLIIFLMYVAFGAILLPALNGEVDFLNGLYANFICLTAIDFGELVPIEVSLLPITFLYVCIGLAISTIAIEIGSEYMKKLHYLGKKMKNVASNKIWFGGKTVKVKDLLHAVGKKCGIEPGMIDALDLDNVVERTIALQEGREPPEDTNDEPPREPSPRADTPDEREDTPSPTRSEHSPFMKTPSPPPSPQIVVRQPTMQSHDMPYFYSPPVEPKMFTPMPMRCRVEEPVVCAEDRAEDDHRVLIIEPPATTEDIKIESVPIVPFILEAAPSSSTSSNRSRSVSPEEKVMVPKKFKEKKKMFGTDPRRLYETYQEEWDRLERLSDRKHGPRRKSILNLHSTHGSDRSGASSPQNQV